LPIWKNARLVERCWRSFWLWADYAPAPQALRESGERALAEGFDTRSVSESEVGLTMANALERIQSAVAGNKILIFMKGNRNFPQCGFSAATVQIFEQLGAPYETIDVLSDPEIRDQVKAYSNWPTIP